MALEELRRWDDLRVAGRGAHLRKLADAAEKLRGDDGLAQFLSRLESVDHRFHSHQLEHFSATIGREAAVEMAEKMKGRDIDVGPARPIESFFESFWEDVKRVRCGTTWPSLVESCSCHKGRRTGQRRRAWFGAPG